MLQAGKLDIWGSVCFKGTLSTRNDSAAYPAPTQWVLEGNKGGGLSDRV